MKKQIYGTFDMNWKISKSSGTIQLNPLMPPSVVYPKNHQNSGSIGNLWLLHHKSFANFIKKFKLSYNIWKLK